MIAQRLCLVSVLITLMSGEVRAQANEGHGNVLVSTPEQTDLTPGATGPAVMPASRSLVPHPDELGGLWRVIQSGGLDEARQTLQRLQGRYTTWTPPVDLRNAIVQLDIDRAASARDLSALVRLRVQNPELFGCAATSNAWGLAEGLMQRGDAREALNIYLGLAQDCEADDDRGRALIEALKTPAPRDIQFVLQRVELLPALSAQLQKRVKVPMVGARLRLLLSAAGPSRDALRARLETDIADAQDPEQATALASFDLTSNDAEGALAWFNKALSWGGDITAVEGKVAALAMLGRVAEAQQVAKRAGLPETILAGGFRQTALGKVRAGAIPGAFADAAMAGQSGAPGVWEDLGWALIDAKRPQDARRAFSSAPKTESARYGLLVALNSSRAPWSDVAAQCPSKERSARMTQLCVGVLEATAKLAYDAEQWSDVGKLHSQGRDLALESPALDEFAGWSAFRLKNWPAAVDLLTPAYRQGKDVGAGVLGALGELGRAEEAAEILRASSRRLEQDRVYVAAAYATRATKKASDGELTAALQDVKLAQAFDKTSLETFGWAMLDASQPAIAAEAFADAVMTENALYGRILALQRTRAPWAQILALCNVASRADRVGQACRDSAAETANAAYAREDWDEVLDIYSAAVDVDAAASGLQQIAGWSALRVGEPNRAIELFNDAFTAGEDVGPGLISAYRDAGRLDELNARLDEDKGALTSAFDAEIVQPLISREQYAEAFALAPKRFPQYAGLDKPSGGVSIFLRDKRGDIGRDRMNASAQLIFGQATVGEGLLMATLDRRRVKVGNAQPGDLVGRVGTTIVNVDDASRTLLTPSVHWRGTAKPWTISVELGLSPLGGAIGARPVGRFEVQTTRDTLILSGGAYSSPRFDSLLAMAGMRDPFNGEAWGRVIESGLTVGAIYIPAENWSLSGTASFSSLNGRRVQDNDRVQTRLSASRQWVTPKFDFVRWGVFHAWQSFENNLSFFTFGHGGYFSPQNQNSFGSNLDVRTRAGDAWLFEGQFSLGWTTQSEDSNQRFPLAPDNQLLGGSRGSGISFESLLRASRLLNEEFRLGAYARASTAPNYRDYSGGVTLTYSLGQRGGLVPQDLPVFMDRSNR